MMSVADFVDALRAYCGATGGSVTSFGRTPAHNADVGGHPESAHLVWRAGDVVYDADLPEHHRRDLAARVGLQLVVETDHDHLQAPKEGKNGP